MRQGQQNNNNNKRMRGRNNNNNSNRKGPNPLTRSYESNGPDVKIRGTALHIAEKYVTLARDAQSSGDRVMAENYLQHAEHYFRVIAAAQAQNPQNNQQQQPFYRADQEEDGMDEEDDRFSERFGQPHQHERAPQGERQPGRENDGNTVGPNDPQPYINGANGNGNGQGEGGDRQPSDRQERFERQGRQDRQDRNDRQDRGERQDRGDRQDRGERQPRGERGDRRDRQDRGDRGNRGERADHSQLPRFVTGGPARPASEPSQPAVEADKDAFAEAPVAFEAPAPVAAAPVEPAPIAEAAPVVETAPVAEPAPAAPAPTRRRAPKAEPVAAKAEQPALDLEQQTSEAAEGGEEEFRPRKRRTTRSRARAGDDAEPALATEPAGEE